MGQCGVCLTTFLGFAAIVLTITGSIMFGIQRHKENYFVENNCLVLKEEIIIHSCSNYAICYVPIWTVQYDRKLVTISNSTTLVRIMGSYLRKYVDALDELELHPINSSHKCYHDKRTSENTAQWDKPSSTNGLIVLVVGCVLIFTTIVACSIMFFMHR
ncbi:unnamed protein product [Adineta ricciae]|uniref:Uncharacterized protein n=1 Tax=Adineta ricciae TaxID=249248 RepID=A0A815H8M3_ADIRI|nr:unnamed protein product [Adineta ricciae]CAF1348852.1 unnamed protein product [Adineta ricciae]